MATVRKAITIGRSADEVWDAVGDAGALHTRVAPHVVTRCTLAAAGEERIVTFVNGVVLRELIISNDPAARRLAWSAQSDQWQHHNASIIVTPLGERSCEVVWTADVLPHSAGALMQQYLTMGLESMKSHMDSA
jgi:hypothetical protein